MYLDEIIDQIAKNLRTAFPNGYLTRFAPSPTGYLHLGHIASMLIIQKVTALSNGRVNLRIEDHDLSRARPEYLNAIVDDLMFLGFTFTNLNESTEKFLKGRYVQSNNLDRYKKYLKQLQDSGLVYLCECSRKEIKTRTGNSPNTDLVYDGYCKNKNIDIPTNLHSSKYSLRFKVDKDFQLKCNSDPFLNESPKTLSSKTAANSCGDFILLDKDNNFSYQYAVVCDDICEDINVVIRGEDILYSTPRQIELMKALGGKKEVVYYHHPLLIDDKGEKLSKRFLSTSVRDLITSGLTKEDILELAWNQINKKPL